MLGNLKLVLLQHKRFLALFFLIIFLPSIILAVLGIRAIHNERYKQRLQNRERQVAFVKAVQAEVLSLIETYSSILVEISGSRAFVTRDYPALRDEVFQRARAQSLLGQAVLWSPTSPPWLPGLQEYPPDTETFAAPLEWSELQPDLARAEEAEFRRRNLKEAVLLYGRVLRKARDSQVRAWIQSRVARCQVKQQDFAEALATYRSILTDFPDLRTESGRPLGLVTRLQILDALRSEPDDEAFFRESLEVYRLLERNAWSLDGDQIETYANMLNDLTDGAKFPTEYADSVEALQDTVNTRLEVWRRASFVQDNVLPGLSGPGGGPGTSRSDGRPVHRESFERGGEGVLALILPVDRGGTGRYEDYLGSIFLDAELIAALDPGLMDSRPPGSEIMFRSMLTGKAIGRGISSTFSTGTAAGSNAASGADAAARADTAAHQGYAAGSAPVFEDVFPENFPPWKVEAYEVKNLTSAQPLYKNIFFWTILALLVILFLGSVLIIRTIVQEVNLLNLKSEFIASVSHEFKTPLTAMGAILERLLSDEVKDPQKTHEYYRILSHDSERLKRLVKNVLDFTKIEEGKRRYRKASLDIIPLVRREVESFENENKMSDFTLELQISGDIPPVFADAEAMSQALHNILDNAAKFSDREKRIDLEVRRAQNTIEISVTDRGIGIPENEQKKIFEKFFRGKRASTVSPTGTGLGLTLVKHIMTAHGGDVAIQSRPGAGSRVALILPISEGG